MTSSISTTVVDSQCQSQPHDSLT